MTRTTGEQAPSVVPRAWIDALGGAISHRGPDEQGEHQATHDAAHERTLVCLLHHRLAIIDASGGHQPMHGADATVVFNGCVYNHRDLRARLQSRGARFVSNHSDTETLLHAYREWGLAMCEHLDSMHAFALHDARTGDVYLSQDECLERPLWWGRFRSVGASAPDVFAFASLPAGLVRLQRAIEGRVRGAHGPSLLSWLRHGASERPPLPACVPLRARGVLASARQLLAQGARAVPPAPSPGRTSESFSPARCASLMARAVESRLESDVEVGCFLSGGIDSSLVAACALEHKPTLQTFCVRMPDARYDESPIASMVAARLGTKHHTLDVHLTDPANDLVDLITTLGAPLGDSSLLATHWVARATRRHVRVALTGDGGDELFAGYERHVAAMHLARLAPAIRALPFWIGDAHALAHPRSLRSKLARLLLAAQGDWLDLRAIFPRDMLAEVVSLPEHPVEGTLDHAPAWEDLDAPEADFAGPLADDLLLKVDHACLRVALEARCPLLARPLREAARSTSLVALMSPTGEASAWRALFPQRKALLRTVARQRLGPAIADRPKSGFAVPLARWLGPGGALAGLLEEIVADSTAYLPEITGFTVNRPAIRRLLIAQQAGAHHEQRLYALLVLGVWSRWVGGISRGSVN